MDELDKRREMLAKSADGVELSALEAKRRRLENDYWQAADAIVQLLTHDIDSLELRLQRSAGAMAAGKRWRFETYEAKMIKIRRAVNFARSRLMVAQKRLSQLPESDGSREARHYSAHFYTLIRSSDFTLARLAENRRLRRYKNSGVASVSLSGEFGTDGGVV